jgi:hypothetical protein
VLENTNLATSAVSVKSARRKYDRFERWDFTRQCGLANLNLTSPYVPVKALVSDNTDATLGESSSHGRGGVSITPITVNSVLGRRNPEHKRLKVSRALMCMAHKPYPTGDNHCEKPAGRICKPGSELPGRCVGFHLAGPGASSLPSTPVSLQRIPAAFVLVVPIICLIGNFVESRSAYSRLLFNDVWCVRRLRREPFFSESPVWYAVLQPNGPI